jgi:CBS domain-containing protein
MALRPIDFVHQTPPFNQLSQAELDLVEQHLREAKYFWEARILERDGPVSQSLYLIRHGSVRLERGGHVIQTLEEGEFFGYPSLLSGNPPSADVITNQDSIVYLIPEAIFKQLLNNQVFAEFFMRGLSGRFRTMARAEGKPAGDTLISPVGTLVRRSLIAVEPDTTVSEAAQVMRDAGVSCLIVNSQPPGILTDRDLRNRVLATGRNGGTLVAEVMTQPAKSVPAETPLISALLYMFEQRLHHLPVTDHDRIIGLVTPTDLLRHQAQSPLFLLKRLEHLKDEPESLAGYAPKIVSTVKTLYENGLGPAQIGPVVASLNDTLAKRLLQLAEVKCGPPPTPYAWLVFGSDGRKEQMLLTDQDNALVYQDDTPDAKAYFAQFTGFMLDRLVQAGFPPCPGGYTATHWHYPLARWVEKFRSWVERPEPQALLEAAIFFDFRVVCGKLDVAPVEQFILRAKDSHVFLAHLARTALSFRPPLGFFGRIRAKNGLVDLKKGGIAPIVGIARVYGLEAGSLSRSSLERIEAAVEAGALSRQGANNLADTYRLLQRLRLRAQLASISEDRQPDNNLSLDSLSSLDRKYLREAFASVREIQQAIELRFNTGMLG